MSDGLRRKILKNLSYYTNAADDLHFYEAEARFARALKLVLPSIESPSLLEAVARALGIEGDEE